MNAILRNATGAGRTILTGLVDLLLPNVCPGCRGAAVEKGGLCEACSVKLLSLVALPYCPRCGATLGPNVPIYPDGCWRCPTPLPRFSRVFRLGPYAQPLKRAIRDLKYRGRAGVTRQLCHLLAQVVETIEEDAKPDILVPVPMYWTRRIWRGMDHAQLLGEWLEAELQVPVERQLVRIRNTPPQVHLNRAQRATNVRRAFKVASKASVRGARVLLVDDVTTTGATGNEAARTLLRAGASSVTLVVLAKSEPPRAYTQHWEREANEE